MGIPRDQIKHAASLRISDVLAGLGIREPARGHSIVMCNPVRAEKSPSLQIWLKPGYEGAWKDYGAGLKGDVFDLVAYFNGWDHESDRGFGKSAEWLSQLLGLAQGNRPAPNLAALRAQQERRAKDADAQSEKNRRRALGVFLHGEDIAGSPAEIYLASRGIEFARLKKPPGSLRYLPKHLHRESERELPCMVALMQGADGQPRAIHRTWLAADSRAKADVEPQRKIWPKFAGSVITIARGCSGLPVKEASEAGIADTLVLAEGIEDALSIAVADPDPRVWAVGSLGNLAHVPVPGCATDIIVAVDNDWGKREAAEALQRGLDHLASFGVPVVTMRSPLGKDANDLMRGAA